MKQSQKGKYIGIVGTLIVHALGIALLYWLTVGIPEQQEEGGVPILLGEVLNAQDSMDPSLVDVDVMAEEPELEEKLDPVESTEEAVITQTDEESVVIKKKEDKKVKKQEKKKEISKPVKKEPTAEELKKIAEAKAEKERKAAAALANKRVAGAFGKGSKMDGSGTSSAGDGIEGKQNGFSSQGAVDGGPTFNLKGRTPYGSGNLPTPVYNVQEEGRVVITITVNPEGRVVKAEVNTQLTNTVINALRKAALDAALKARFNKVSGSTNQIGTITYKFTLK